MAEVEFLGTPFVHGHRRIILDVTGHSVMSSNYSTT